MCDMISFPAGAAIGNGSASDGFGDGSRLKIFTLFLRVEIFWQLAHGPMWLMWLEIWHVTSTNLVAEV